MFSVQRVDLGVDQSVLTFGLKARRVVLLRASPMDVSGLFERERVVFSLRTSHKAKAQKIASRFSLKPEQRHQYS